jgi:hypothetical protein
MAPRRLRDAAQLVAPAVEAMASAMDPPGEDEPLLALARTLSATIDGMPEALRPTMLPQCSGQLVRVLTELHKRAAARGRPGARRGPNRIAQLRAAHAQSAAVRRRGGLP